MNKDSDKREGLGVLVVVENRAIGKEERSDETRREEKEFHKHKTVQSR